MSQLVLIENFDLSIFEVKDQMVNLTKIGKHFGKDVNTWLKSKKVQEFITKLNTISDKQNLTIAKGGDVGVVEQGTFGTEKVALKFAEYISTDFEIWANDKIHTLLNKGKVELQTTSNNLVINADFLEQVTKQMRKLELEKQEIIEKTKPAVEFQQTVNNAINSITVADFAKILGTGEIKLYKWLRLNEYLMSKPNNRPYQKYLDSGHFKVIEKTFKDQMTGEDKTYFQTLITGKGQTYLAKKFNQSLLLLK